MLDNGNLNGSDFLIPGTAHIDFDVIMSFDFLTAVILSGRKMGKTYGFWKWFARSCFPSYEILMHGEPQDRFGSIVGKTNEITTSDMIAPWNEYLEQILPEDYRFDFEVRNRLCYINIIKEDHRGKDVVIKSHKIGAYGALSQVNTLRRLGNQKIKKLLIEECNPEKSDHPFVGNDISRLSSAITSIIREADNVQIIALGNQQLYPSIPLKYLRFNEDELGYNNRQLRLMLNRPKIDNSNNFLSVVSSSDEYDSFSRTIIHDVETLKEEPNYYVSKFNREPDVFITSSRQITLVGWQTKFKGEKALFITVPFEDYETDAKQAYELSPYSEEVESYSNQLDYIQKMYYDGRVVIGKGDRETYYSLSQLGCESQSKAKELVRSIH